MKRRQRSVPWQQAWERSVVAAGRIAARAGAQALAGAMKPAIARRCPPPGEGSWSLGVALGAGGMRRFRLYRPPGVEGDESLPLVVMLHGCGQDARSFAESTRMNRIALRERFLVLYPEQDRLANAQGCWNWFDTDSGRAYAEAALIMKAIEQVCRWQPVDRQRVAIAGMSAGASMAALLATRQPARFKAIVMHSGIPPGAAHSSLTAWGAMHGLRTPFVTAPAPGTMAADRPPLLVIHGSRDGVVSPFNGRAAAEAWAQAAGARAGAARRVQRGQRYAMLITDFKRRDRTVATLVAVDRLAHAWSGGAPTKPFGDARGPDASRMVWAFLAKHFSHAADGPPPEGR